MNELIRTHALASGQVVQLVYGDLILEQVDALVNAANSQLMHGGGVAGHISRQGGPAIQVESNAWVRLHGPVSHAEPAYTTAGELPCRFVIHAVGPEWGEGDEDAKLEAAIRGSLRLADQLKAASIAFPAISTGIFGFPKERAARIILETILDYFRAHPDSEIKQARLVLYDSPTLDAFVEAWTDRGLGE